MMEAWVFEPSRFRIFMVLLVTVDKTTRHRILLKKETRKALVRVNIVYGCVIRSSIYYHLCANLFDVATAKTWHRGGLHCQCRIFANDTKRFNGHLEQVWMQMRSCPGSCSRQNVSAAPAPIVKTRKSIPRLPPAILYKHKVPPILLFGRRFFGMSCALYTSTITRSSHTRT